MAKISCRCYIPEAGVGDPDPGILVGSGSRYLSRIRILFFPGSDPDPEIDWMPGPGPDYRLGLKLSPIGFRIHRF